MALNWSGGAAGAGTGLAAGSAFGPIGTAVGGGLGFLGGLFSGSKDKTKNVSTQLPEQRQGLLDILSQLKGMGSPEGTYGLSQDYLKNLLSPGGFEQFAQPYQTHFQEQVLPSIAERFAGLGGGLGGGALGSSGFAQALGGAGTQYSSNLAQFYQQLQNQAAQSAMGQYNNLANLGLNTQAFQQNYRPGEVGFGGRSLSAILEGPVGQELASKGISTLSDKIKGWQDTPGAPAYKSKQTGKGIVTTTRK